MIIQADILEWAERYDGEPFHAALMDCPYEMEFMGKGWDNSGVSFQVETWTAIAKHLHPGAFLFVFAGTINDDLISIAMRQAGLRKYHKAMAWGFGSGFPKAARIDTVIDRQAGVERTKIGTRRHQPKFAAKDFDYRKKDNGYNSRDRESFDVTEPATDMARDWAGHRYGGQLIKPAVETILVFQKPYDGPPVESMVRTGAGALWIDGARIDTDEDCSRKPAPNDGVVGSDFGIRAAMGGTGHPGGRWPANLVLSHLPDCNGTCAPGCPVAALGAQSGESVSKQSIRGKAGKNKFNGILNGGDVYENQFDHEAGHDDTGTAARFFYNADWQYERLEQADPVGYFAKASKSEREAGLDDMQVRLLREWYGMDETEEIEEFDLARRTDGRETEHETGHLRTSPRRNVHPCVKPIALNRWLATLLLPPARYTPRRLLIPFAGVASEYIGALLAGWEEIVGVELEAQHVKIAEARIAYWRQMQYRLMNPDEPIKLRPGAKVPDGQLELF